MDRPCHGNPWPDSPRRSNKLIESSGNDGYFGEPNYYIVIIIIIVNNNSK